MKLLTKEIREKLLKAGREGNPEQKIIAKFFNPTGAGTWYALDAEESGDDLICFGYVTGLAYDEFGSFSINELQAYRGRFGLGIERDIHFPVGKRTLKEECPSIAA